MSSYNNRHPGLATPTYQSVGVWSPMLADDRQSIVSGVPVEQSSSKDDSEVISTRDKDATRVAGETENMSGNLLN